VRERTARRARLALALGALAVAVFHATGCMDCHGMGYDAPTRPNTGQPHRHPDAP
jgi:hypothetical protein